MNTKLNKLAGIFFVIGFNLIILMGLAWLWTTSAHANADFTVNTTADTHDASPGDGLCADSNGDCSLRAAIEETNALTTTDNIALPAGNYLLNNGALWISDATTLTGEAMTTTILDAQGLDRILFVSKAITPNLVQVQISHLTLQNGARSDNGGGIWNNQILKLQNLKISSNTSGVSGGGIYNMGTLTITNSLITNNSAINGAGITSEYTGVVQNKIEDSVISNNIGLDEYESRGGGLHLAGLWLIQNDKIFGNQSNQGAGIYSGLGYLKIVDSQILDNTGIGAYSEGGGLRTNNETVIFNSNFTNNSAFNGGGLYKAIVAETELINTYFISNTASAAGGGIYAEIDDGLSVIKSVVVNNTAWRGGGLYLTGAGNQVSILRSMITDNKAIVENGGGILIDMSSGTFTIDESLVSGNYAANNGGGYSRLPYSGANTVVNNSTFSGNQADGNGGAIFFDNFSSGWLKLNHTTIANNYSNINGGGLWDDTENLFVTLKNTILADNSDLGGNSSDCGSTPDSIILSLGFNLIENLEGCNFTPVDGDITGVDPLLGMLANNGGETFTHALLVGSPAIDTGSCTDIYGNRVIKDQRDFFRPLEVNCDIGAYEVEGIEPINTYLPLINH